MHVNDIYTYRCHSCKRVVTSVELEKLGKCPFCSSDRMEGASPSKLEIIKVLIRLAWKGLL